MKARYNPPINQSATLVNISLMAPLFLITLLPVYDIRVLFVLSVQLQRKCGQGHKKATDSFPGNLRPIKIYFTLYRYLDQLQHRLLILQNVNAETLSFQTRMNFQPR